jgi:prepilin-type N-terminal cleavage/methylation domain-containing protein
MKIFSRRRGMTLLEVLVVIGIIGILAGLLIPATMKMRHRARGTKEKADRLELMSAILAFHAENGMWPTGDEISGKGEFPNEDVIARLAPTALYNTKRKLFYESDGEITLASGMALYVGINPDGRYPISEGRSEFDSNYKVYFVIR